MFNFQNKTGQCAVCNDEHTSMHFEVMPGVKVYVCDNCLKAAKYNFIWICMKCGKVYMRPKTHVLKKIDNYELRRAYALIEDKQIIQGIDMCIECDPEGIFNFMNNKKIKAEC